MNKWYQGIVVEHKEIDNKMYHCFDDENFEKLTNERNEQLKEIERLKEQLNDEIQEELKQSEIMVKKQEEIERLNNIIKEVRELLKNDYFEDGSFTNYKKVFELLDKGE